MMAWVRGWLAAWGHLLGLPVLLGGPSEVGLNLLLGPGTKERAEKAGSVFIPPSQHLDPGPTDRSEQCRCEVGERGVCHFCAKSQKDQSGLARCPPCVDACPLPRSTNYHLGVPYRDDIRCLSCKSWFFLYMF